ncbi:EamA family transporter [Croceicoccus sp. F390]|uniref:EamA family transporter n=1 Tax=Croceicoccus esteveae TaxID=3075597 RepID=A0ABU2ZEU4_9SPHN|nr:EamA family transporter [Croceicoccus sp. F390]MDT0574608.1 EamA family transporter [Croceicoccus sp. F390]
MAHELVKPAVDPAMAEAMRPRIIVSFILVTLIWGSTWLVIKDQISMVPPGWTVTYRFALATIGMFALAVWRKETLRLLPGGVIIAAFVGISQFMMNFQFVYRAELHITSGLVAVCFAMLMVPNALLGRIFLGQHITRGFTIGSAIAIGGIALLMTHEYRAAPAGMNVPLGILLTVGGILSASVANVAQGSERAKRQAMVPLLAWAMLAGTLCDAVFAYATSGPPVWDGRWQYAAGIAYLAIVGSVITFPLYFNLIRLIGPGRAAYNGVAVPVVAMILSTLFEGYRWTTLAGGGAVLAMVGLVIALRSRR